MEGPFLVACARNAWQKLGNIGSEEAMNRYIAVVSEMSPDWNKGQSKVKSSNPLPAFGPFSISIQTLQTIRIFGNPSIFVQWGLDD